MSVKSKPESKSKTTKDVKTKQAKEVTKPKVDATVDTKTPEDSKSKEAKSEVVSESKSTAKSGKRSDKGIKEAEDKQSRLEQQAKVHTDLDSKAKPTKPKHVQNIRTKLERSSKGYRKASELLETGKVYSVKEAMEVIVKTSPVKFDATVELHVRLGIDPKQADQNIRDIVTLPAGTGKTLRVAVFAETELAAAAKKAGADISSGDEFLQQLEKGTIDFDILIVTPSQMPKLGKFARLLGPKGLMPNPKSGTVTQDVVKAVTEAKAGRLEYRVDSTGIIHVGIGKVSFGPEKLLQNAQALFTSVKNNKPSTLKAVYVKSIFATTSMGPSISIELSSV